MGFFSVTKALRVIHSRPKLARNREPFPAQVIVRKEITRNVYVLCLITDNYVVGVRLVLELKGLRGN